MQPYINTNSKLNSERAKLMTNVSQKLIPYPLSTKHEEMLLNPQNFTTE